MRSAVLRLAAVAALAAGIPGEARADCTPYSGAGHTNLITVACDEPVVFGNAGEDWTITVGYIGSSAGNWHSLWAFTADQADNIGIATGNGPGDPTSGGIFLFCKVDGCGNASNPGGQSATSFSWVGGEELVFGLYVKDDQYGNYWLFSGGRGSFDQVLEWGRAPKRDGTAGNYGADMGPMPGEGYRVFGFEDTKFSNDCVKKKTGPTNKCDSAKGDWDYNDAVFYFAGEFNDDPGIPTETVPEPATMTLLATGLAGMAAARRRRK